MFGDVSHSRLNMKTIIKIDKNLVVSRLRLSLLEDITGIAYSKTERSVVFFRSSDGTVGFIKDDDSVSFSDKRVEMKNPLAMCCDQWGTILFQASDEILWRFDQSLKFGKRFCGKVIYKGLQDMFPANIENYSPIGMCRIMPSVVLMAFPWRHQIIRVRENTLLEPIGCGKSGFLSSESIKTVRFNCPSGICFDDKSGLIIVSDSGNSILRLFKNDKEVAFLGNPKQSSSIDGGVSSARFIYPSKISSDRGKVAVIDGNLIRAFSTQDLRVNTAYISSSKIIDLVVAGDNIYALEEDL